MVRLTPAGVCAFASPTAVAANPATPHSAQAANFLRDNIDPSCDPIHKVQPVLRAGRMSGYRGRFCLDDTAKSQFDPNTPPASPLPRPRRVGKADRNYFR